MSLKKLFFSLLFILIPLSCIDSTTPEVDCQGIIGGNARVDYCGFCTGGTTGLINNFSIGCDSGCTGNQYDCSFNPNDSSTWESSCVGEKQYYYYCDFYTPDNSASDTLLNLATRKEECLDYNVDHDCGPNTEVCRYVACNHPDSIRYSNKEEDVLPVIDCNGDLPMCDEDEDTCYYYNLWDGSDDGCDTILNCIEFNYDWGECSQ